MDSLAEALERYEPVIGLEVHAQLNTDSKLFSGAKSGFSPNSPNQNISTYCLGLPGQLPVLNQKAVELAVRAGVALGCNIRPESIFARKQYFYPDLPKGYQISQYDQPLCEGGKLDLPPLDEKAGPTRIHLTRIHMEEDAGKSIHVKEATYSLLDYNRAGVPLIEIVSEPEIRSASEAATYLRELRNLLRYLDVCDGNMEQGNFRCDANVSIRPKGQKKLGDRVELKNINSFRFVEQAIEIEILRQARLLSSGQAIQQQTRLFDPEKKQTRTMRSKEEAADYRYFPDPDLPPLTVSESLLTSVKETMPELPALRKARWQTEWRIPAEHAQVFSEERALADWFDQAVGDAPKLAPAIANLMKTELLRELKGEPEAIRNAKLSPTDLRGLVEAKESGKISSSQTKKIFGKLWQGGQLQTLLQAEGAKVQDTQILEPMIDQLLAEHPKEAEKLRAGEKKVVGFFVGRVMKATGGKADPATVNRLLSEKM